MTPEEVHARLQTNRNGHHSEDDFERVPLPDAPQLAPLVSAVIKELSARRKAIDEAIEALSRVR